MVLLGHYQFVAIYFLAAIEARKKEPAL